MSGQEVDRLLREGIVALRAGDKATAREKLMRAVEIDETNEQAWLWLSGAVETDEDRRVCLENVLTINPDNELARKGLAKLGFGVPEIAAAPTPAPAIEEDPGRYRLEHARPRFQEESEADAWRRKRSEENISAWDASARIETDASYLRDEKSSHRSLLDLPNAWLQLMIFNVHGDFAEEIDDPDFLHILANLGLVSFLQIATILIGLALFLSTFTLRVQELVLDPSRLPSFDTAEGFSVLLGEDPITAMAAIMVGALNDTGESANELLDTLQNMSISNLITLNLILIPGVVVGVFIGGFVKGWVANAVSVFLSGKGDVINSTLALSTADVVGAIIALPAILLIPVLPLSGLFFAWLFYSFYMWAVQGAALGKAQAYGTLPGMGLIIVTGIVVQILSSIASAGLSLGVSLLSAF